MISQSMFLFTDASSWTTSQAAVCLSWYLRNSANQRTGKVSEISLDHTNAVRARIDEQ